ncbi:uncharacterized protein K452DRAFT_231630 [Aplosporella prunicola CBS 121167]|uniref:DUF7624 domain-containing protein n=1 Tax=Aplosporella prunicola CBS 121167 TaxID=1176127 RepID=A0A6A6B841_9PEZI|nr:uncharacterized protein K452DRAFT_231630 [Aplosporella prunicola CBS 121167]KAF2140086.1 hypothetical protein K452DRAFT_231630 [Aplosporella prunicola CBS 121167]
MATATQLMPSPNTHNLKSAFSPYSDSPSSPYHFPHRSSASDSLHPPPSPYPIAVEPSPVDSNGTGTTDIDEDAQDFDDDDEREVMDDNDDMASPARSLPQLDTAARARSNSDEAPQSVIHAPPGFQQFGSRRSMTSPTPTDRSSNTTNTVTSAPELAVCLVPEHVGVRLQITQRSSEPPHNIDTSVPAKNDRATPRAQTREEAEEAHKKRNRVSRSLDLEDIAETDDATTDKHTIDTDDEDMGQSQTIGQALQDLNHAEQEINALKTALSECWTLCNTLAGLSSIHRERMFSFSGKGEQGEQAWKSCWRLCQKLYESRNEDHASQVRPTLELCRSFCQALFEARHIADEASDSVLRVSFELNNHLYNTHDRALPEAFRERTLDFYLTLCHRLMKQRTALPQETDALLRACWSLAEMLFSLRQNNRDGKPADEELLGSAVQACWELCDLFREGWTQVRPDRGTPRPSQGGFAAPQSQTTWSSGGGRSTQSQRGGGAASVPPPASEHASSIDESLYHSFDDNSYHSVKLSSFPPETPTTIFDDVGDEPLSGDEGGLNSAPNILVLGPEGGATRTHNRWSSAASTLSGYSESSAASSTTTATRRKEDPHLVRLKGLILKAAMNAGFSRGLGLTLPQFVKALPGDSFGSAGWQMQLLGQYRKLVLSDPTLRVPAERLLGSGGGGNGNDQQQQLRLGAVEVARAVQWMGRAEQFAWFTDLYRLVFGFFPEDAGRGGGGAVAIVVGV